MNHSLVGCVIGGVALASLPLGGEEVCHRCAEIRAYNALHHRNYDYYDDYLKEQKEQGETAREPIADVVLKALNGGKSQK